MKLARLCTLGMLVIAAPAALAAADRKPASRPAAYASVSAEAAEAAFARARGLARLVETQFGLSLAEVETDHFLIFTDWAKGDHAFLRRNLEAANAAVSGQFGVSPRENVFVGKLPVYMFAKKDDFLRFAQQIDEAALPDSALGYFAFSSDGLGHMSMWQPDVAAERGDLKAAQVKWARTLTHEFTHAFLHRYRGDRLIPRWLNEGVAEVIANGQFPLPPNSTHRAVARQIANERRDLSFLFDDENVPDGQYYPVMETMAQMLIGRDRRRFVAMVDAIKDGADPADALKSSYGLDYNRLVIEWRRYVVGGER